MRPSVITPHSALPEKDSTYMPPNIDPNLIAAWIAFTNSEKGTAEHDRNVWAFDEALQECDANPAVAWEFIMAVLAADPSDRIMESLSAGPLEELLVNHPNEAIAWVEKEAKENPHFASLLGGVWQNAMPDEIWQRVQAVWDRRGWDDTPAAGAQKG